MLTVDGGGGTFPPPAIRISMTTHTMKTIPAVIPMRLYQRRRTVVLATTGSPRRRKHQYPVQDPHGQSNGGRSDVRKHRVQPRSDVAIHDHAFFHRTAPLPRAIRI